MLRHRCPWCGEKIKISNALSFFISKKSNACPFCKNKLKLDLKEHKRYLIILVIIFISVETMLGVRTRTAIWNSEIATANILLAISFVWLALFILMILRTPWKNEKSTEKASVVVKINWLKHSNNGLFLPRWQTMSGEIFPACFIDASGNPISTTLCIVLDKLYWSNNYYCTCRIHFVLDNISEDKLFCRGNQFYLYYNYQEIATGTVQ